MNVSERVYLQHRIRQLKQNKEFMVKAFGEDYYKRHLEKLEKRLKEAEK